MLFNFQWSFSTPSPPHSEALVRIDHVLTSFWSRFWRSLASRVLCSETSARISWLCPQLWLENLHIYPFFRSFPMQAVDTVWFPDPGNSVNLFLFLFPWVFQGNNDTLNRVASLSMPIAVYHLSSISTSLSFLSNLCFCSGLNLFKPRKNLATETQIVGDQRSGAPSVGEWSCGAQSSGSLTWTGDVQTSGTQKPCAIMRNSSEHWRMR